MKKTYTIYPNPPAKGFNLADSDAKAVALADSVMNAVGGRKAWDDTHYIRWNFFGNRVWIWDKFANRVRMESKKRDLKVLMDMNTMQCKLWLDGKENTNTDSITKYSKICKESFINDSYWLLMPFKLKDDGVTLKYLGMKPSEYSIDCHVVSLTFDGVGVTPQNKYHIYINPNSHLITQWDYYENASDEKAKFSNAWANYNPYGGIVLAINRGKSNFYDLGVYNELPESAFTSFDAVNWAAITNPPKKKKKK